MNRHALFGSRIVNVGLVTFLVAVALFEPLQSLVPRAELVLGVGVIGVWVLGQRYERERIVAAELADRDDIRENARESRRWYH